MELQVSSVLYSIGDKGRAVIQELLHCPDGILSGPGKVSKRATEHTELGPITQIVQYCGGPLTITHLDVEALVRHAQSTDGTIALLCAVGDTLVEGTPLLEIHGGKSKASERELMRAIHLGRERTFEQDPKYPIRLLVDVAIKALSPAINDPTTAVQAIDQIETRFAA